MNADAKGLQINVMGREFRVACPDNEQKGLLEFYRRAHAIGLIPAPPELRFHGQA